MWLENMARLCSSKPSPIIQKIAGGTESARCDRASFILLASRSKRLKLAIENMIDHVMLHVKVIHCLRSRSLLSWMTG